MKNVFKFTIQKLIALSIYSCCAAPFTGDLHAQLIAPTVVQYRSPKSPNVDRLQTFLEVPTNLNTGQLAMNIPLYEIKAGPLTIPISLDYANTGFKVKDIPSWVGMGWNLSAGGLVTRTVRGLPDDLPNAGIMSQYPRVLSCLDNTISHLNRYQFYREIVDGEADSQFDEYHFTFLGRSGRFYVNKDGTVVGLPKNNLKITFTNNSGIQNFTIVDESGVSFLFGIREESSSVSSDDNVFARNYYNWQTGVSWYLTKIILPNSQEVLFEYDNYSLTYHQYMESLTLEGGGATQCGQAAYQLALFDVSTPEYHLKKISWPLGRVEFIPGSFRQDLKELNAAINSPSLSSIKVFDNNSLLKKNITCGMINGNRLLLKSVNFLNVISGVVESSYELNYYGEGATWPSLSNGSTDRNAQDLWGYYNGVAQNSLLPFFAVPVYLAPGTYSFGGYGQTVNRVPNASYAMYGMLKDIVYPTGGKTTFEYEPNQATYPDYNSIPTLLKAIVGMTYQTILEDQVYTDGNSVTNQSNSKPFNLTSNVERARIVTVETTNDPTGFANMSSSIATYPGSENPNDCNCGHVTTTANPYSHTYTREYYMDLPAGNYQTGVSASSYDNYSAGAYIRVEVPVAQSYTAQLGGLRLKKMYFDDGVSGVQMVKRYQYDFEGAEKVNIKHFPTFVNTISRNYMIPGCFTCCSPCSVPLATLHAASVSPTPGFHLEYPKVVELSGESGENGRIVHSFTNTPFIGGFTAKPYADPAALVWYGGIEHKSEIQKYLSPAAFTTVKEETKNLDGENFPNYNSFDMSLKVAVKDLDYCAGYPAILFPNSNNEAATLVASAFAAEFVPVYTEYFTPVSSSTVEYFQASSNQITNSMSLAYAAVNKLLPSSNQSSGSKGEMMKSRSKYVEDYLIPTNISLSNEVQGIQLLKSKNMLSSVIERVNTLQNAGGVEAITSGELFEYYPNSTLVRRKYVLSISAPIPTTSFQFSSVSSGGVFVKDSRYILDYEVAGYDAFENLVQINSRDGLTRSMLWGYEHSLPICEVENASVAQIAYTSFESAEQGNFQFTGTINGSSTGVTGKKYYNLTTSAPISAQVVAGQKYILSYWSNGSGAFSVTGTSSASHLPGRSLPGWYYHEHAVTAQGTTITISGTGSIDEVRLFPTGAQMVTFTYDPLYGMSSKCDANGSVTYFEYDGHGRLSLVRDQDKNILKQYSYQLSNVGTNDPLAAPDWQATGQTRCKPCESNLNYNTHLTQAEEKDMNPSSYFYNQTRWVDGEEGDCGWTDWEETGAPIACAQNQDGTYFLSKEYRDINPCSEDFGYTWFSPIEFAATSCPNNLVYVGGSYSPDISVTATLVGQEGTFNVDLKAQGVAPRPYIIPVGIYTMNLTLPAIPAGTYYHIRIGDKLLITEHQGGTISISNVLINHANGNYYVNAGPYVFMSEFAPMLWNKKYKIVAYYSDTENLWSEVPIWVQDDVYSVNTFGAGWVDAKTEKKPGDSRDGWAFNWKLYGLNDQIALDALDLDYNTVIYHPEYYIQDSYFLVSHMKNGVKVYVKYEQVNE